MTKMISIKNAETGEEIVREMNEQELADYALGENSYSDRIAAEKETMDAKKAILQSLGITSEEAQLILGGSN